LLDRAAHSDDVSYCRYRTFLCRLSPAQEAIAGARDGIATIRAIRWLSIHDDSEWGDEIVDDRFLYSQLQAIRGALARSAPISSTFAGPAFAFPEISPPHRYNESTIARVTDANVALLADMLSSWTADVHHSPPLMAVLVDERAGCCCVGQPSSVPRRGAALQHKLE
jgi:hypothetical protein